MIFFYFFITPSNIFFIYVATAVKCDTNVGGSLNKMYILYVYVYIQLIFVIVRILEKSILSFGSSDIFLFFVHSIIKRASFDLRILYDGIVLSSYAWRILSFFLVLLLPRGLFLSSDIKKEKKKRTNYRRNISDIWRLENQTLFLLYKKRLTYLSLRIMPINSVYDLTNFLINIFIISISSY